jgi:uncharacterized protein
VNVWIALTYARHVHHEVARVWFEALDMEERVCFCRFTQLSLLRLLTTEAVMGAEEVMTQAQAWEAYDLWLADSRILFLEEPSNLDPIFRSLSRLRHPNPKTWSDSYLAAFAIGSGLRLVTFDQGFQGKIKQLLVLKA